MRTGSREPPRRRLTRCSYSRYTVCSPSIWAGGRRMTMQALQTIDDALFGIDMAMRAAAEWITTGMLFNPQRAELRVDPYPFYRRLRETDPVHRSYPASGWVLTRYADIVTVLTDRTASADERNWLRYRRESARHVRAGLPDFYEAGLASMLRIDPPDHTRLRTLVSKAFTPRAIE